MEMHGITVKMVLNVAHELMKGAQFIKYGRRGKPHERYVWISAPEDEILWKNSKKHNPTPKSIRLCDIVNVYVGSNSTKVLRANKVPPELDNVVFSIETPRRTLDLRAPDLKTRSQWENYFKQKLLEQRHIPTEQLIELKAKANKNREQVSEIWKVDILPNFHFHWDYTHRQPRGMNELDQKNRKSEDPTFYRNKSPKVRRKSTVVDFLLCRSRSHYPHRRNDIPLTESGQIYGNDDRTTTEESELRALCRNKSLLLYHVWRLGIPEWLRRTIWPISIGNRLEITLTLYQMLLSQAQNLLREKEKYPAFAHSHQLMEKDMPDTFWDSEYFNTPENKQVIRSTLAFSHCT